MCPSRETLVIEIGPGRGALTEKLLERADRVVAIEVDGRMVEHLRLRFAGESRLEVIGGDVLATDLGHWGRVPLAGNLPYYISSPILEKASRLRPPRAVFLIQEEVARRLTAKPGGRDYGYLTVQTALFSEARYLFGVKPGAFQPPPQVDSAVVMLEPRREPLVEADAEGLLRFVGICFSHKRKTLRNNLAPVYGRETIEAWPEASQRAEQIPPEGFVAMWQRVATSNPG